MSIDDQASGQARSNIFVSRMLFLACHLVDSDERALDLGERFIPSKLLPVPGEIPGIPDRVNPAAATIWPFIPREAAPRDVLTDDGRARSESINPVEEIPEGVEDRILR